MASKKLAALKIIDDAIRDMQTCSMEKDFLSNR